MSRYVSAELRRIVATRAKFRCEYCLMPEIAAMVKFQVEHIISLKHGGSTTSENLAFACPICNSEKGTDIGTLLEDEDTLIRFFNPRKQEWSEHFFIDHGQILSKTEIGAATVKILQFNRLERMLERLELAGAGFYPSEG